MKVNVSKILSIVFFVQGLVFVLVGLFLARNIFSYDMVSETKGTVIDIERTTSRRYDDNVSYNVTVAYNIDGIEHVSGLDYYSSAFEIGKEIDIYYYNDNVEKIGTKTADMVFLIFTLIGLIFIITSIIIFILEISKKNLEKRLLECGNKVYARYVKVQENQMYTVCGKHPYQIYCSYRNPENGMTYTAISKFIWENPEKYIEERTITYFPLYVDENNYKKYYLDISQIEEVIDRSKNKYKDEF